jgi:hypothetical protein
MKIRILGTEKKNRGNQKQWVNCDMNNTGVQKLIALKIKDKMNIKVARLMK